MASAPPSFYGRDPRIARVSGPETASAGQRVADGIGAAGQAALRVAGNRIETDSRERQTDLQIKLIEDQRDLSQRTAAAAADLATRQGALLTAIAEQRGRAGAGAEGHEQEVGRLIDGFRSDFMATIAGDQRLTDAFADNVAQIVASARVSETRFAIERRAARAVSDIDRLIDTSANTLFTAAVGGTASNAQLEAAEALIERTIAAQPLPEDAREEYRRRARRELRTRALQGAIENNPDAAIAALDGGALNGVLEDGQIAALRNNAIAERDRRAAQARAAHNAGLEEFRATARSTIEDVNEGVASDPGSISAQAAQARALGDEALARDLDVAAAQAATNARFPIGTPPAQLHAAQREIEATHNWQQDRRLVAAHTQLGRLIERTGDRAQNDQLGLHVAGGGGALPALNLNDGAAMARRFNIGDAAAARYGRPAQYLTEDEAQPLRAEFNAANQTRRAEMIAAMAAYGNARGRRLMAQLAPNQPQFATLIDLATMRDRNAGRQRISEALDGFAQPATSRVVANDRMEAALRREFGTAMSGMPGQTRAGILTVAQGIYRHRATRGNIDRFSEELWIQSVNAALGRAGDTGGAVNWRGNQRVVLPRGMSRENVERALTYMSPSELMAAAGRDAPLWSDGRPMSANEFRGLTPVLVSDAGDQALYAFRGGNGGLVRSQQHPGRDFIVDLRALATAVAMRARLNAGRQARGPR